MSANPLSNFVDGLRDALSFYTRLPVGNSSAFKLDRATQYLLWVGLVIAVIAWSVFWASDLIGLSTNVSSLLVLAVCTWVTGALHEDGFADCIDGFGGAWERSRILEIMKDSRVGAYGAVALCLLCLLKFVLFAELATLLGVGSELLAVLLAWSILSRLGPLIVMSLGQYARAEDEQSKVAQVATFQFSSVMTKSGLPLALALAACWLVFGISFLSVVVLVVLIGGVAYLSSRYFTSKLGGYTGDCLGLVQQVSEITVLLFFSGLVGS